MEEWAIEKINSHHGKGADVIFKLVWKTGDLAWLPYHEVQHLEVLGQYLEALGVPKISNLRKHISKDKNIPVGCIAPEDELQLQGLVTEIIGEFAQYVNHEAPANVFGAKDQPDVKRTKAQHARTCKGPHLNPAMSTDEATYQAFINQLLNGLYDPSTGKAMPDGYVNWALSLQFADLAPPMPPGIPITIEIRGRCETHVLAPSTAPEVVTMSNNTDHGDRLRCDSDSECGHTQGHGSGQGRGCGCGRGGAHNQHQCQSVEQRLQEGTLQILDMDLELSKPAPTRTFFHGVDQRVPGHARMMANVECECGISRYHSCAYRESMSPETKDHHKHKQDQHVAPSHKDRLSCADHKTLTQQGQPPCQASAPWPPSAALQRISLWKYEG